MLLITHNVGVVAALADFVAVLHDGRVIEAGDVREILENPQHPYTRSLLVAGGPGGVGARHRAAAERGRP